MSRRFPLKSEIPRIEEGFRDYQQEAGTHVWWYVHQHTERTMHPVYGEAYEGGGAVFDGPYRIPVLWIDHTEGERQDAEGFYTTDRIRFAISTEALRIRGLDNLEHNREHKRDRIIYNDVLFRFDSANVRGRLRDHDVVVGVSARELDPDELVNDPVFLHYSEHGITPIPPGVS